MKTILIASICMGCLTFAGAQQKDWQHLDLEKNHLFGISDYKADSVLLKGKKPKPVIVAILDGGTDTAHRELRRVLWTNPKERPSNHRDDDHNGYIDDIHGWVFIGGAGGDVQYDNLELVRMMRSGDTVGHPEMRKDYETQLKEAQVTLAAISRFKNVLDTIINAIGKPQPTAADIESYNPADKIQAHVKQVMINVLANMALQDFVKEQIDAGIEHFKAIIDYQLNLSYDPRSIVGDNYSDDKQRYYGNNDVTGPDALHGTHVAGIVGADGSDTAGVKGIATNVRLMIIRAVPNGDERDKDIANGIRYAVDNGARIINMSFGKTYSFDKPAVDAAVKYAMSKNVLLIHAAGNDSKDLDSAWNYPNPVYADGSGEAGSWITVGASGSTDDEHLVADFSNYGASHVDVFAPGVNIYSSIPGSKYQTESGTSMAAPVVTGLAALIMEYYPKLSALQVKDIILRSVTRIDHPLMVTRNGKPVSLPFTTLCKAGGIVNAYNALKLAATY